MRTTHTAGGVVVGPDKKILVVNQHGNAWSLPKGHVDSGEDSKDAAKREIKEESGVSELKFVKELGSYERFRIGADGVGEDKSDLKIITMYLFTTTQKDLEPEDPDNPEARWVAAEDVETLLTHLKDKEFFAGIKDQVLNLV